MAASTIDWAKYAEKVGFAIFGEPNKALSKAGREIRWGENGSVSLNLQKGTFYDHSDQQGWGVVDLLKKEWGADWRDRLAQQPFVDGTDRKALTRRSSSANGAKPNGNGAAHDYPDDYAGGERDDGTLQNPATDSGSENGSVILGADGKPLTSSWRETKRYDYRAANGTIAYQVRRKEKVGKGNKKDKIFSQHQPSGADGWIADIVGVKLLLYRLPELQDAGTDDLVYFPEGEKDADTLFVAGMTATTNSGGAQKWEKQLAEHLRGRHVVMLVDNDKSGRERIMRVAPDVRAVAASLRVLDIAHIWKDAHEKADVTDWFEKGGGTALKLQKIAKKLPIWEPPIPQTKFGAVPFADLFKAAEPYPWLIRGILPAGERVMIYGEPQSGKSFATLDMAMHVARGADYIGRKTKQVGVAYCAFEGGKGFRGRAKACAVHHSIGPDAKLPFMIFTRQVDLFADDKTTAELVHEMGAWSLTFSTPIGLIVIDTVSAATAGMNENDSADVGKFLAVARAMKDAFGPLCTIVLVHHKPKGGDGPRGSGKMTGDLESTIEVKFDENGLKEEKTNRAIRRMKVIKQREGETGFEWPFTLPSHKLGVEEDGADYTTCVVEHITEGNVREAQVYHDTGFELFGADQKAAFRSLQKAIEEFGDLVPAALNKDRPTGVKIPHWFEVDQRRAIAIDENAGDDPKANAARKKTLQRLARKWRDDFKLVETGHTGPHNSWIWRTDKKVKGIDRPERIAAVAAEARTETTADLLNSQHTEDDDLPFG